MHHSHRRAAVAGLRCLAHMCGGGNGDGVRDFVDQAQGQGFFGGEVVVFAIGQPALDVGLGYALGDKAGGNGGAVRIERIGVLAQLDCIAVEATPRCMHHEQGVGCHAARAAGLGDQAGDAVSATIDLGHHGGLVALERVVDGNAIGDATAVAVDAHRELSNIERGDIAHKVFGGNGVVPPALANVTVNQHLCGALHARGCSGHSRLVTDGVPGCSGSSRHEKSPLVAMGSSLKNRL